MAVSPLPIHFLLLTHHPPDLFSSFLFFLPLFPRHSFGSHHPAPSTLPLFIVHSNSCRSSVLWYKIHAGSMLPARRPLCCGDNAETQKLNPADKNLPAATHEYGTNCLGPHLQPSHTHAEKTATYVDIGTRTCTCGNKLLIQVSGDGFVWETVPLHLLMRQRPFNGSYANHREWVREEPVSHTLRGYQHQ